MTGTKNCIEEHKKTLLEICGKADHGDVASDFKCFNHALEKDGLIIADLFNDGNFDKAAGEDLQKQIEIFGHINQFIGLESCSIQRQDRIAALEEADNHLAKAFEMAKSASTPIDTKRYTTASDTPATAFHKAVHGNIAPLIRRLQMPPTYH